MRSLAEIIHSDKPVLVDFFTEWFGPCKAMMPELEALKNNVGENATVINVNVEKNSRAGITYQVQSVPTLMLFKKGKVLWRQAGIVPAAQLEVIIRNYL